VEVVCATNIGVIPIRFENVHWHLGGSSCNARTFPSPWKAVVVGSR
jgi:hypothetical protein